MANDFNEHSGIVFEQAGDGNYVGSVDLEGKHMNIYGVVHGGLLYTLADTTGGINTFKYLKKPVTLSSDFHFFRNTGSGKITCTAQALHGGKKTAVMQVQVHDEKNTLLCEGTFTYYDVSK